MSFDTHELSRTYRSFASGHGHLSMPASLSRTSSDVHEHRANTLRCSPDSSRPRSSREDRVRPSRRRCSFRSSRRRGMRPLSRYGSISFRRPLPSSVPILFRGAFPRDRGWILFREPSTPSRRPNPISSAVSLRRELPISNDLLLEDRSRSHRPRSSFEERFRPHRTRSPLEDRFRFRLRPSFEERLRLRRLRPSSEDRRPLIAALPSFEDLRRSSCGTRRPRSPCEDRVHFSFVLLAKTAAAATLNPFRDPPLRRSRTSFEIRFRSGRASPRRSASGPVTHLFWRSVSRTRSRSS
jgi:hypothetical protein